MAQWRKVVVSGSSPEFAVVSASSDIHATGNIKTVGDLTVAGGDIVLGTTSIFSGGDTTSLNNIDAIDTTTENTIEAALDTLSNVTTVGALDAGSITSNFGSINNGSSAITTTGTITGEQITSTDDITAAGTISGSVLNADTIGQNRVDGIKTITIEANSTINQDVSSDAIVQFASVSASANIQAVGYVSASSINVQGAADFDSLTLDTQLAVAEGGTGATSLTDKAVLISQDSGTDAVGSLALTGNGEIIVGGTNGPAVEAAADVAGTGLDAAVGDGTLAINVAAAQTSITSIINSSLGKIGTAADQEYIDFGTSNEVNTKIVNSEIHSVTADGVDITGAVTISGNLDVNGSLTTIDSTNLRVADRFIYASSGSTSGDGGLIIGTGANGIGTAIGYDDSVKRWGLTKEDDTAHDATAIAPRQYVVSVSGSATAPSTNPHDFGTAAGDRIGMMHVNTDNGEIWIYS